MGISVVINTLNEEINLPDCIRSVAGIADEIVVCDMYSDDRTVEIATSLGARVITHQKTGYVEPARKFAITAAMHEWVLVLDADERCTQPIKEKLLEVSKTGNYDLVKFGILYNYFGKYIRHGGFYNINFPRFFRKTYYLETYNDSETLSHNNFRSMEKGDGCILQLGEEYYLVHEAYPSIEKYVVKTVGHYARLKGEEAVSSGRKFSLRTLLLSPIRAFIDRFFLKRGYKEGIAGFIVCFYYAVYIFSISANIWLLEQNQKQETVTK